MWRALSDAQLDFLKRSAGAIPAACCFGLTALMLSEEPGRETVAVLPDEMFPDALKMILRKWSPEMSMLVKTPACAEALAAAAPFTAPMIAKDGKATYYVCTDGASALPVSL